MTEATVTVYGNHCGLFSESFILNFESIIQKQMGADFWFTVFIGAIGRLVLNPGLHVMLPSRHSVRKQKTLTCVFVQLLFCSYFSS